jgi:hypothetical protein
MLFAVRYVLPAILVAAGFLCLVVAPESTRLEGWAGFTGAGLSILLLNVLYRIGVSGDAERDTEQDQRDYLDRHGHWPDEKPSAAESRQWHLPDGVATPESEAATERARRRSPDHPRS